MNFKVTEIGELPLEWDVDTMENALDEIIDYRGKTPAKSEAGIETLSAKSVKNGYIDYSKAYFISEMTYQKFMVRGFPRKGDILLTTEAPLGLVAKLDREKVGIAQRLLTLRGKKDYLLNDYLLYYLMSNEGQHQLTSRQSGTTVTGIKQKEFRKCLISIPPFEEQKAIAHILSTLDDKIEVNNQINKTLENMAQAIFKQWFVDFEFPNENGEPYKSSGGEMVESELGTIPKGWEVVQFRDIFRFVKGKKPKTIAECEFKDSEKYLTIDVLNRNSVLFCSKEKVIEANSEDVLMVMDGASSGVIYFGQKGVVASTLAKLELISKKVSNQFLFYAIKYFENDIKTHTTGSAIPHTDKEYAYRLMIALPNDISLQTKIDDLLCDISDTFIAREQENAVLKATRDTLLPKLMSGEIRVPLDQDGYAS